MFVNWVRGNYCKSPTSDTSGGYGFAVSSHHCACKRKVLLEEFRPFVTFMIAFVTFCSFRSSIFALHCSEPPISAQLLAFLRVFCMTEGKTHTHNLKLWQEDFPSGSSLPRSQTPVTQPPHATLHTLFPARSSLAPRSPLRQAAASHPGSPAGVERKRRVEEGGGEGAGRGVYCPFP